ncbi:MAG: hypothetical protein AAF184_09355 [Pseudomonadota bacterium]
MRRWLLSLKSCLLFSLIAGGAASVLNVAHAHGGEHDPAPTPTRVLGEISFPTSTDSKAAQAEFIRGMLLLHLFEYDFAKAHFQEAQRLDPAFVMAYWGEAMVHNHPLWDQQNREAALAVLARLGDGAQARAARATNDKERDFLASLEVLYGEGTKSQRDAAYRRTMGQMAALYADDREVQLFHALAIMGEGAGVRDVPAYMESAAISQAVFYANREHPGAAHYLIHAVDDPIHAPLGLEAARALAIMAPDAGHSLHMTSHIFTALGMWSDVVTANTEASRVANAMASERGRKARSWGHYNFWLLYGLLQEGKATEARRLLEAAHGELPGASRADMDVLELDADRSQLGSTVQMWARYLIEIGGRDPKVAAWEFDLGEAYDPQLLYHYVKALTARELPDIGQHLAAFLDLQSSLDAALTAQNRRTAWNELYMDRLEVMLLQIRAVLARADGDKEKMLSHARAASEREGRMPYSYGPPFVDYPAAQFLGDLLLAEERYEGAAQAYREQLARSRNRVQALRGLEAAEGARR